MTDIHIVGLGIASVAQMTRQAEDAIRRSNEVFYLDTGVATREYLSQICPRVTSLYDSNYREKQRRLDDYHHMAATVVDAALDNAPVCFAIHGHPLVAVTAPFMVLRLADLLGLSVECQPGVSAIDTVLADLQIDPVVTGIQMYEATDLLLRERPLQSDVPALLWQIGSLESTLHTQRKSLPARFRKFVDFLRGFYPANHPVVAVHSAPHPLMNSTKIECELGRLAEHASELHAGFTLYVPATRQRAIRDVELLNRLADPDYLDSVTQ